MFDEIAKKSNFDYTITQFTLPTQFLNALLKNFNQQLCNKHISLTRDNFKFARVHVAKHKAIKLEINSTCM